MLCIHHRNNNHLKKSVINQMMDECTGKLIVKKNLNELFS